jgi:hypothetical protein
MSDEETSNVQIEELGLAWLHYHETQDESDEWPLDLLEKWIHDGCITDAWRLIKDVCGRVEDDLRLISNIGAEPLESFVVTFGDRAMDLIEPELDDNPTLLAALAMVLRRDTPIRPRIDRVLAEHGQERPDLVARATASWLETTAADKAPDYWIHDLEMEWADTDFEKFWKFILSLCETVDSKNEKVIEMIGVDPLYSLMIFFPDQTLQAIEDVAEQQPTLISALSSVLGAGSEQRNARMDAILARYGNQGES